MTLRTGRHVLRRTGGLQNQMLRATVLLRRLQNTTIVDILDLMLIVQCFHVLMRRVLFVIKHVISLNEGIPVRYDHTVRLSSRILALIDKVGSTNCAPDQILLLDVLLFELSLDLRHFLLK